MGPGRAVETGNPEVCVIIGPMSQGWDRRRLRLVVFDWDGTLMDSVGSIVACTQAAVADLGWGPVSSESIRGSVGLGLREAMLSLLPAAQHGDYERLLERYRAHWLGGLREQPFLFPGVEPMLARLEAAGLLLAVATGKSRRGLDHALEQSSLAGRFHATRTADEALSKPHPQMLLDILAELGVGAGEAVVVGDTTYDLDMARNAGTAAVAVLSGTQPREELARSGPLALLDRVAELPAWLGMDGALDALAPPSV